MSKDSPQIIALNVCYACGHVLYAEKPEVVLPTGEGIIEWQCKANCKCTAAGCLPSYRQDVIDEDEEF